MHPYAGWFVPDNFDPTGHATCTPKECDKCVNEAMNDPEMKKLTKKGGLGVGAPGYYTDCKPDISCIECRNKRSMGKYDRATKKITICANNMQKSPTKAHNDCSHVIETVRHEYIHQLNQCLKKRKGGWDYGGEGPGSCSDCYCDEVLAYGKSGQCDNGSVWRSIPGPYGVYASKEECIQIGALESCPTCTVGVPPDKTSRLTAAAALSAKCKDPF